MAKLIAAFEQSALSGQSVPREDWPYAANTCDHVAQISRYLNHSDTKPGSSGKNTSGDSYGKRIPPPHTRIP